MSAPITVDNNKLARSGVDATTRPSPSSGPEKSEVVPTTDIEHAAVDNDPRLWSARRKRSILGMVATAAMIATLGVNIINPALKEIMIDLHANNAQIALSLSLFIVCQGGFPLLWAAISEVKGRKPVYLASLLIFTTACAICGVSNTIELLIGMRVLQAAGGAAVLTIGAGTLADMYEPHERGTVLGIYYAAPLLGPSLGPIIGGVLTQIWNWRATFYFLAAFGGLLLVLFLFFRDTFRPLRSTYYQNALANLRKQGPNKPTSVPNSPVEATAKEHTIDVEKDAGCHSDTRRDLRLSLRDVNPFPQFVMVIKRKSNLIILIPSGLLFAMSYSIAYTCSVTLAAVPYNYDALHIGLVLLAYGLGESRVAVTVTMSDHLNPVTPGSMAGSILGGRWSDRTLAKLRDQNGGINTPEMRLESTKICMPLLPASILVYAWVAHIHLHVASIIVSLFFIGLSSLWIYSSTLAYVVDANVGRSSTAVATNSLSRGAMGFIASEAAVPLQLAIGDGGLYTLWAALCVILNVLILVAIRRGGKWRDEAIVREEQRMHKRESS